MNRQNASTHNTLQEIKKSHSIVSAELESLKVTFQLQIDQLSQSLVQQELLMRRKLLKARQDAEQENVALLRLYEERECQLLKKLQTSYEELLRLEQNAGEREQELVRQTTQARQELEILLRTMLQREQEVSKQFLKAHQTAEAEKAGLKQIHEEREKELARQTTLARQEVESLLRTLLQREQEFGEQLSKVQQTVKAEKVELEQSHREHERNLDETIAGLRKQISIVEAELQQQNLQIQTEQNTCLQLRQILAEVRHDLNLTHSSLTWRITAPLRRLAVFFNPSKQLGLSPPVVEQPSSAITESGTFSTSNSFSHHSSKEFDMTVSDQSEAQIRATAASTLNELLALQDRSFISCAYQTLLGRAPDHEGLTYYLGRIRSGISKISILGQLRLSNEGKRSAVNLPGLDDTIRRNRWIQNPFLGWIVRLFTGCEGNTAIERKLRGIENQIFLLREENSCNSTQIASELHELQRLLKLDNQALLDSLKQSYIESDLVAADSDGLSVKETSQIDKLISESAVKRVSELIKEKGAVI